MFSCFSDGTEMYLEPVCRSNANIGRYSISELHFNDVPNDKIFGANVDLLTTSDGKCILQLKLLA